MKKSMLFLLALLLATATFNACKKDDAQGFWSYTKTATDMKLTFTDGTFTTWDKMRTVIL